MYTIIFMDEPGTNDIDPSGKTPPEKSSGKFVQLQSASGDFLVFSTRELCRFHADIVERFCKEREIPGIYLETEKRFDILDNAWRIIGGGKFVVDTSRRHIRLFDNSMAYGKFNAHGMKTRILSTERFHGYDVLIE